ncbi:MAG TPA: LysM peptidoglycan-binding domain-containing protein [Acidimicrobiales bacterium]|nr:LysM peptidoglycan-binding domain-containing protein [Acidimicrobiales bacterium]
MSATMLPLYAPVARRSPGRPAPQVYRRRRLAAVAMVGVVVLAGVLVVRALGVAPLSGAGRHAPVAVVAAPATGSETTAPAAAGAAGPAVHLDAQPVAETSYVVQPGDTLWTIARRLQPDGDVRPVVDRLAAQLHGHPLDAGQRLVLPAAGGGGR